MSDGRTASDRTGDRILPFQLERSGIRGRLIELTGVADEILSRHDYPEPVAELLGESLALAAALAATLKFDGVFTLQTKGDGPLRLLVSDITSDGDLRGYAEVAEGRDGEIPSPPLDRPVAELLGGGHLAFTVDQGSHTQRYQGIVDMSGDTMAECAAHYFRQSEQLPTGLRLAAGRNESGAWRAMALLVQQVPFDDNDYDTGWDVAGLDEEKAQDDWRRTNMLMETLTREEMLNAGGGRPDSAENILFRLFHEDGVRVFESRELAAGCRCSRQRVESVLRTMPAAELEDLADDGVVTVNCQFCNRAYRFDTVDLGALESAGTGTA